jgi:hypothetical protein
MTPAIRVAQAAQVPISLPRYEHNPKADSVGLEAAWRQHVPPDFAFPCPAGLSQPLRHRLGIW